MSIGSLRMWGCLPVAFFAAALWSVPTGLHAAPLPGSADAGRVDQREAVPHPEPSLLPPAVPMQVVPPAQAPEASKHVKVILNDVRITGMNAFTTSDIKDIYTPYIGHEVTLDTAWMIAAQLTEHYHNAGYFISRVVVPQQEIKDGIVVLHAVEGYIGEVKFDDPLAQNRIVQKWIGKLLSFHPIKSDQIESALLNLNDLPGVDIRTVMEPITNDTESEGAVRLVIERKDTPLVSGNISFDNYGSRFLGPYEAQAQAQINYIPTQRTTVAMTSSVSGGDMKYGSLKHEMPVFAGGTLELYGSYTKTVPGYTLKPEDIRSLSPMLGTALDYSVIRQRQENLTGRVAFELHNTATDILGSSLTKDDVRAVRFNLNYQIADSWDGQNTLDGTLSQGLNLLGASQPGQIDSSRAGARPDFTKFDWNASRQQGVTDNWDFITALAAQLSDGPLYSSEQFGYGGQAFGRAYDDSEITGDQGAAASVEFRYSGLDPWCGFFKPQPYEFYDIGAVWNDGSEATTPYATGSSAGAGLRIMADNGFASNFGFAFPLTRSVANPLSGNGKSPRYFMQLSYGF